jgi:hypothetical protein
LHFLLQAQDSKPGEHLVRVTGGSSWYNKRSISAEVDLEPGTYEVLPKISATRTPSKPFAEDVVKKAAEENPQKLRQIGLNYDIAHVKGGFEEEEEERKKKAEAKAKKLKAEKEMKERDEKENAEREKAEVRKENAEREKAEKEKAEKEKVEELIKPKTEDKDEDQKEDIKPETTEPEKEKAESEAEKPSTTAEETKKEGNEPAPDTEKPDVEESPNPWNAVAVIGLRAYSKDPDLVVTLVKPKDLEEAAMLDVDGVSGAGATA